MIEKILPDLYRIEVPLPDNPLKSLNSYIVKSKNRNLLIDTGMNREECLRVMLEGLKELNIDLNNTDLFITHLHTDHLGLAAELASGSSRIYFNQPEADIISKSSFLNDMIEFVKISGFPQERLADAFLKHPGYKYKPTGPMNFTICKEGDIIKAGHYIFRCIETPGHSPGHICLYEEQKKILVSGDHILGTITPNIALISDDSNPLKCYLESLDITACLDIKLALPGHREMIRDCRGRIKELKEHHEKRINEIIDILRGTGMNAYEIASKMTWDITYESWTDVPVPQQWFATAEAKSHLKYLEQKGILTRKMEGDIIIYLLA